MEEIKNFEDKNIQRLREEFNQRQKQNENHPKTSHGIKHSINQYININHNYYNSKYKSYNKALSANKYKQNIKNNHFIYKNNFPIDKNHPGYLYYKEILKYTQRNKKRYLTGKAFNRKLKLEPIIKPKNKNIFEGYHLYNDKFPKLINKEKKEINERRTYYNNKNNKGYLHFPFWADKKVGKNDFRFETNAPQVNSRKNDLALKYLNKKKDKNNFSKKISLDNYNNNNNKLNTKNVYYNNFMNKDINKLSNGKKTKDKTNKQINKDLNKNNNIINNDNLNGYNEKEKINIFDLNEKDKLENKQNKEEINNNEENENIDEEKEKLFYTNQKNFFKVRKDIMEEPEYLEEDNENDIKKDE